MAADWATSLETDRRACLIGREAKKIGEKLPNGSQNSSFIKQCKLTVNLEDHRGHKVKALNYLKSFLSIVQLHSSSADSLRNVQIFHDSIVVLLSNTLRVIQPLTQKGELVCERDSITIKNTANTLVCELCGKK